MTRRKSAFTLSELMVSLFLVALVVLGVLAMASSALSTRQKSGNLLQAQLTAERELARWIYAAQSDTPGGTRASFWNSAPPGPWRNGSLKMGNTDFTYAIYAETLNYAGGSTNVGMGTAATANRLKKVDIVVWWWDGQIRDARPGQGRLTTQASRVVNEIEP